MASQRSAQNPYQWADGSWHSISQARHDQNEAAKNPNTPNLGQIAAGGGLQQAQAAQAAPPAPQPFDPALEAQKLTAGRNIALGNAESAYQTGNLNFDYGYNPDGTLNTANPYSRAALYQLGYENQKRGTTNSMAAQGQLYSGAIGNQRNTDARGYAINEANNRLAYQRAQHDVQSNRLGTYANNAIGVGSGDFDSLLKATYPGT